jgi:hypothetical protein
MINICIYFGCIAAKLGEVTNTPNLPVGAGGDAEQSSRSTFSSIIGGYKPPGDSSA